MKKIKLLSLSVMGLVGSSFVLAFSLTSCGSSDVSTNSGESNTPVKVFSVTSSEIKENTADKPGEYYMNMDYGSNGTGTRYKFGSYSIFSTSIPVQWENEPSATNYYALQLVDLTEPWTHWLMANINKNSLTNRNSLPNNYASLAINQTGVNKPLTGITSWYQPSVPNVTDIVNGGYYAGFGGFTPPASDHQYEFTLYALSSPLVLNNFFSKNDLEIAAMSEVVLAKASFKFWYRFTGATYTNQYW